MTEKKVIETQYGWYQKNDDKVNVDDIIGIVKTEEQTNSVEEVRKLRGRENKTAKRFNIEFDGHQYFLVIDEDNERCLARLDTRMDALAWLEMYKMLSEENEQLKQTIKKLEAQLYCTFDSVCDICEYHYFLPRKNYYISQCRKEHTECGKEDIKYCDDFELKGGDVE